MKVFPVRKKKKSKSHLPYFCPTSDLTYNLCIILVGIQTGVDPKKNHENMVDSSCRVLKDTCLASSAGTGRHTEASAGPVSLE